MNIRAAKQDDIKGLINLSGKFSREHEWAKQVPIGSIDNYAKAEEWLFGENIFKVLVAEDKGSLIGYLGVKKYQEGYEASILVDSKFRGQGIGKRLTDEVFKLIPREIEVEAWVADFNEESLKITPKLGFKFKNKFKEKNFIPGREFYVHVFTRQGGKY